MPDPRRFEKKGLSLDKGIRFFFASNAGLTIVILVLIIAFLLKEGLGFFPGYRRELETYRIAGLEFVDISRRGLTNHEELTSVLNRAYQAEINGKASRELKRMTEANAVVNAFGDQVAGPRDLYVNNLDQGIQPDTGIMRTLLGRYAEARTRALADAPATPHLTAAERKSLLEELSQREPTNTDPPALVAALTADYAAAREKYAAPLGPLRETIDAFENASAPLAENVSEMTTAVTATKEAIQNADILENERRTLLAAANNAKDPTERAKLRSEAEASLAEKPDIATPMNALMARKPQCQQTIRDLRNAAEPLLAALPPSLSQPEANRLLGAARKATPAYLAALDAAPAKIEAWDSTQPVSITTAIWKFLTGKDWVTGGEWQDFYGIVPLFVGTLVISLIALVIAIPVGIGAAIYINRFGSRAEQTYVKPVIEFIQAIPSVVLGFLGIMVLGTLLREWSQADWLTWVPGFPISERLNMFTAGCLLALMAIPTVFALSEDALNNVPAAYAEAADALGASRFQTTFRVIVPAAFSGMLAAALLGLGRVVGETMVVLLVAGNRIKIPDFSAGIGTVFQPAHTLTGIIAQELGEVPLGSVHYRALFVIGILLFAIVLGLNAIAHRFFHRKHN